MTNSDALAKEVVLLLAKYRIEHASLVVIDYPEILILGSTQDRNELSQILLAGLNTVNGAEGVKQVAEENYMASVELGAHKVAKGIH